MFYLHHTKYLNHAQPRWQAKQLFHTFDIFKTFSVFTQYMSVSHGYSTICGIEWRLWRRQQEGKIVSHQLALQETVNLPSVDYRRQRPKSRRQRFCRQQTQTAKISRQNILCRQPFVEMTAKILPSVKNQLCRQPNNLQTAKKSIFAISQTPSLPSTSNITDGIEIFFNQIKTEPTLHNWD